MMRLQKYMAQCAVASRRESEILIAKGCVSVNGTVIDIPGYQVNEREDVVTVNGKRITNDPLKYYLIHKPVGYVSTVKDRHAGKTVLDLIPGQERIYPVGRLDKDTSGLMILTNDGDLTYRLTHPSHTFEKKYLCTVKGHVSDQDIRLLENGIEIEVNGETYLTAPAKVFVSDQNRGSTTLEISIFEGKNRQIRKMMAEIKHPVIRLKRIALGKIEDHRLKNGEWRFLTEEELAYLKEV